MQDLNNDEPKSVLREQDLKEFTGSENWYRHPLFRKFLYTDGVRHVARCGGAYWLLDKIFACQSCVAPIMDQEFVVWELVRNGGSNSARLSCSDGNEAELYYEAILYTDFPLKSIKFYLQANTLFLPSEY